MQHEIFLFSGITEIELIWMVKLIAFGFQDMLLMI